MLNVNKYQIYVHQMEHNALKLMIVWIIVKKVVVLEIRMENIVNGLLQIINVKLQQNVLHYLLH